MHASEPEEATGGFPDRLRALKRFDETQEEFARRLSVSLSGLKKWLSADSVPGLDSLMSIHAATGVNIHWLATGEGRREADAAGPTMTDGLTGEPPGVQYDDELLVEAVAGLEQMLTQERVRRPLDPWVKGRLVAALYRHAARRRAVTAGLDTHQVRRLADDDLKMIDELLTLLLGSR